MTKILTLFVYFGIISLIMSPLVQATQEVSDESGEKKHSFEFTSEFTSLLTKTHDLAAYYDIEQQAESKTEKIREDAVSEQISLLQKAVSDQRLPVCEGSEKIKEFDLAAYNAIVRKREEAVAKKISWLRRQEKNVDLTAYKAMAQEAESEIEQIRQKAVSEQISLFHRQGIKNVDLTRYYDIGQEAESEIEEIRKKAVSEQISLLRQEIKALETRIEGYGAQMGACKEPLYTGKMHFLIGLAYDIIVKAHFWMLEEGHNALTDSDIEKRDNYKKLRLESFKSAKNLFDAKKNIQNVREEKVLMDLLWHAHILRRLEELKPQRKYVEEVYKIAPEIYTKSPLFCERMGDLWTYLSYSASGDEYKGQYDVIRSFKLRPQTFFPENVVVTIKNYLDKEYSDN